MTNLNTYSVILNDHSAIVVDAESVNKAVEFALIRAAREGGTPKTVLYVRDHVNGTQVDFGDKPPEKKSPATAKDMEEQGTPTLFDLDQYTRYPRPY